ncbi:MAG: sigma-54-dependent Fis family transcriptional regulator [Deltaproteobacteria bacterium]|nr:sigma-54-dependent Fis family transcriptional regulator [Deltaproteobacteria bacterium]
MEAEPLDILLVDDSPADARLIKEMLADSGAECRFSVKCAARLDEALKDASVSRYDLILLDLMLPDSRGFDTFITMYRSVKGVPIVVLTGLSDENMAARAVREGAQDYLVKGQVDTGMLIRAMRFAVERRRLAAGRESSWATPKSEERRSVKIVGASAGFREIEELIATISKTSNTSVLIRGETGTGKGVVANAIHFGSNRANGPFIELNCSAIPDNLLETEMFGYEKGAFTDAKQSKKGLFELAEGGTIFLDEIGDMDMRLQPKLLQFLENRTFRKVGGTKDIRVDLRVIAATNKDLEGMVRDKRFREDLYYRLKVMVINIPPLRDRKKDIIPLAEYFLELYSEKASGFKGLSPQCQEIISNYPWPGNVRELKNAIERATILAEGVEIRPEHLPQELKKENTPQAQGVSQFPVSMSLSELERAHILNVLKSVNNNKTIASNILGISRLTLRKKLKDYGVEEDPLS